jgi:hypothetical protein
VTFTGRDDDRLRLHRYMRTSAPTS